MHQHTEMIYANSLKYSELIIIIIFLEWNSNYDIQLWEWYTFDSKIFIGSYITN